MNKVFKVIWSEARNAYVVVSEIAKNHGSKSCSTKKLLTMLIATGVMTCASMAPAMAAPNVDASATVNVGKKAAVNVAENAKVNVKKDAKVNVEESAELTVKNGAKVTFSKDAGIGFENGAKINLGSKAGVTLADGAKLSVAKGSNVSVDKNITMGNGAVSSPYVGQTGNVAIGEKALAWNGNGLQEALMDFGQGGAKVKTFFGFPYGAEIVDGTKLPGSIAIGKNTVARSGSTMIGDHGYTGKIGDTTITPDGNGIMKYNNDVYSTTIGANSFNSGALASVTGVFSIASSKFDGGDSYKSYAVQNTGATIYGSMNSIESATSDAEYSGIASSVLGFANKTQNANAALIWGTGNEVTNSIEKVGINTNWNNVSVAEAQKKAIEAMQSSDYAGGSVMAIGGGNKADYAKYSQLTGVKNKVTGTEAKAAQYDFVNGYQNTVTNASDVTVIGIKNEVTADGNKVIGDNHKVSGKDNVIFGSADEVTETTVNNAVVLGHNAKVIGEGGVALGSGSVASTAAGVLGYGADGKTDATWQATKGAVSVGGNGVTRQITNVAAGTADTDAVNVAQLKKVNEEALKHSTVTDDGVNITVTDEGFNADGGKEYKVALKNDIYLAGDDPDAFVSISGSKGTIWTSGKVTAGSVEAGSVVMDGATATVSGLGNKTTAYAGFATTGKAATEEQLKEVATEAGKHTTLVAGDNVQVKEEKTDNGLKYTVSATDTTYTAGNGIAINGENNAISVKLNKDEANLAVDKEGLSLNKDLKGIESISNNTSKLVLREGWAGMQNGVGASVFMVGGLTTINGRVTVDEQGKISGVAAGVADNDAVNVSQLNKVSVEAGKHTTLSDGKNTTVTSTNKDGQIDYQVNVAGDLKDITSVSNGASKINLNEDSISISNDNKSFAITNSGIGMSYIGADYAAKSIMLGENGTTISGGLNVAGSKITGVAAGTADTDAVNVSQLNKVSVEAGKHSVVTEGANITVTPEQAEDGRMQYNVALKNDIALAGDNDAFVNISGSHGSIWASSSVAAGNVIMDGTTATVSGLGNTTTAYDGFANGEGKAATEEQLKEVSKVAENANQGWNLSTNGGKASKVAPGETVDFSGDKNITISNDGTNVKVKLNENIDVNSVQTNALNSKYNLSVGTMAENGIMPFFVNSTGDFYAAHNKFHVDKDGKVTATAGEIGNVVLQNGVYYGHSTLQDGSLLLTDDNGNHSYIDAKGAKLGKVTVAEDGKISGVAAGAITADSTDAVNGSQLHAVATEASKHSKVVNGSNINVEETDLDGQKIYKVNLNKDIMLGDLTGKYVSISGTNGTIETTGYIATKDRVYADKGAKVADIDVTGDKISNGASSIVLDGSNVKVNDKVTIDQNGKISGVAKGEISSTSTDAINGSQLHQTNENVAANRADIDKNKADIAALDNRVTQNEQNIAQNKADIAQNKADIATNKADIATNKADIATNKANIAQNAADIKKVEALAKKHTTVTAGDNITVTEDTNKDGGKEYKVALDKDIKLDSVTTGQTVMNNDGLKVGKDVSVTATAVTAGKTSISDEGVKVGDKTYISADGLNANDQKVTNVKAGDISETSKDAVNGSQLYKTNQEVANNTNRINQLGSRVNKVGAGAAALAALHPMDFDPDDKLTFSAGYGNYGGENAAAIGAYYRPDEKVMFSVGGTVGNGENMVNAGVSFSLDRTNHVSNSRTAMAREILDLRAEVTELKAMVAKGGLGSIAEDKMKIFPDVAENHWAYEYVGKLAAAGIIEGYPDGNFSGDRMMSRYEFAAMLYRAMQKGAQLDSKIINEFAPEMGRIRVDRISGEDGDRDKIERVRVNAVKGERDHYGNKIAKAEAKAK